MKAYTLPLAISALASLAFFVAVPAGLAQSASATPESTTAGTPSHKCNNGNLTPEEQAKLKAAKAAALQDPTLQALKAAAKEDKQQRKAFHEALRAAMLKADPSIAPILEKVQGGHKHQDGQ